MDIVVAFPLKSIPYAISFPYHSHIPHDGQVLWQRLRRRADAVLAGEIPWTRESWVEQISEELLSVDFDDI